MLPRHCCGFFPYHFPVQMSAILPWASSLYPAFLLCFNGEFIFRLFWNTRCLTPLISIWQSGVNFGSHLQPVLQKWLSLNDQHVSHVNIRLKTLWFIFSLINPWINIQYLQTVTNWFNKCILWINLNICHRISFSFYHRFYNFIFSYNKKVQQFPYSSSK